MRLARPGVPAVAHPVRPRREDLSGTAGRQLVLRVPVHDRLPAHLVRPQTTAHLDDHGGVPTRPDRVLRTGRRDLLHPATLPPPSARFAALICAAPTR